MNIETKSSALLQVPRAGAQAEIEIKKSRFIARAFPVENEELARIEIDRVRSQFPDARHICWAYVIGHPDNAKNMAFSDDGEPSGTAGKPIFSVIQSKSVANICITVTRYFGGIKLGAGGLIRAYAGAASSVIELLDLETQYPRMELAICAGFEFEPSLRRWLSTHSGRLLKTEYEVLVTFTVSVLTKDYNDLRAYCLAHKAEFKTGS